MGGEAVGGPLWRRGTGGASLGSDACAVRRQRKLSDAGQRHPNTRLDLWIKGVRGCKVFTTSASDVEWYVGMYAGMYDV